MNCEEFLIQFREALDGKVSEQTIQDNVNYYRSYIYGQVRDGKKEADVLGMLGDPRLLAKTIEESSKFAGDNGSYAYEQGSNVDYDETEKPKQVRLPGWLVVGIAVVVLVLLISLVFKVFVFFAPAIVIFLIGYFAYRCVQNWLR